MTDNATSLFNPSEEGLQIAQLDTTAATPDATAQGNTNAGGQATPPADAPATQTGIAQPVLDNSINAARDKFVSEVGSGSANIDKALDSAAQAAVQEALKQGASPAQAAEAGVKAKEALAQAVVSVGPGAALNNPNAIISAISAMKAAAPVAAQQAGQSPQTTTQQSGGDAATGAGVTGAGVTGAGVTATDAGAAARQGGQQAQGQQAGMAGPTAPTAPVGPAAPVAPAVGTALTPAGNANSAIAPTATGIGASAAGTASAAAVAAPTNFTTNAGGFGGGLGTTTSITSSGLGGTPSSSSSFGLNSGSSFGLNSNSSFGLSSGGSSNTNLFGSSMGGRQVVTELGSTNTNAGNGIGVAYVLQTVTTSGQLKSMTADVGAPVIKTTETAQNSTMSSSSSVAFTPTNQAAEASKVDTSPIADKSNFGTKPDTAPPPTQPTSNTPPPEAILPGNYSVSDAPQIIEGNNGTKYLAFTVSASGGNRPGSVSWTVSGLETSDFVGDVVPTGTVNLPGNGSQQVLIPIKGEKKIEANETLTITLTPGSMANVVDDEATGTVVNDDGFVAVRARYASVNEGGVGQSASLVFDVTRTNSTGTGTVDYSFAGAGTSTGTVTFAAGETSKAVTISVSGGDAIVEDDRTGTFTLSNPSNLQIDPDFPSASTVIADDDTGGYSIAALNASRSEGVNAATTPFTFVVSRPSSITGNCTIDWKSSPIGGEAADISDFTAGQDVLESNSDFPSGTVTFSGAETSKTITINVAGDTLTGSDEGFLVSLSNASGGAKILNSTVEGTILNDDAQISISAITNSAAEGSGTDGVFKFLITRSGYSADSRTVNYAVAGRGENPITTGEGGDISSLTSGVITFAADETTKTLTVNTNGDSTYEGVENFKVTLSGVGANTTLGVSEARTTVNQDDCQINISALNSVVLEDDLTHTFVISRVGNTSTSPVVSWSVVGNGEDAVAASDFGGTLPSGNVTFAASETSKTITFATSSDLSYEANETYRVNISTSSAGAQIGTSSANGTIVNDEIGIEIASVSLSQNEGNSGTTDYVFSVTRLGAAAQRVGSSVDWNLSLPSSGTPAQSADFTSSQDGLGTNDGLPSGSLSFAAGETSKLVTISVATDAVIENSEAFTVTLSNASSGSVVSTASASGTITNDDAAFSIAASASSQAEGDSDTSYATFVVTRTGDTQGTDTVNYTISGSGSDSIDAADFSGGSYPSGILTFGSGASSKTITATLVADSVVENDEGMTVTLSSNSAGTTITTATASTTITNDDDVISIAASSNSANEGGGASGAALTYTISRTGDTSTASTVNWSVAGSGGNQTSNNDFTATSGTVTLAANESSRTLTINVNPDYNNENTETFTVTLSGTSAGSTIGTATAGGTIVNDDTGLAIAVGTTNVNEGNSGTSAHTFVVTRSGITSGSTTVDWAVTGTGEEGYATDASDFSGATSGTVTFGASETLKTITVNASGDSTVENNEGFTVTLSNGSGNADIQTATSNGTIKSDDASLAITATAASVNEGADGSTQNITYTVTRTGDINGTTTVDWNLGGDVNAADFSNGVATSGTLTFTAGQTSKTISLNLKGDDNVENNENATVTLSSPSTGAVIGTATATTAINTDDTGIAIQASPVSAIEGGVDGEGASASTPMEFVVTRSGITTGTTTVNWNLSAGTVNANDFIAGQDGSGENDGLPSGTLSFGVGETLQTITVNAKGDEAIEANETFSIVLSDPGLNVEVTPSTASGTITNDDSGFAIGRVSDSFDVTEGNSGTQNLVFSITRGGDTAAGTTIDWAVSGHSGSQANATDFGGSFPSGTVTFAENELVRLITFTVAGDSSEEVTEGFQVVLSNSSSGDIVDSTLTGTIITDDTSFAVSANSASIAEGTQAGEGSSTTDVVFTISRSGITTGTQTVNYAVSGTVAASDFLGNALPSGTVTFTSGQTSKLVTVQVNADTDVEANETLTMTISSPSAGTIATAADNTTINNDDIGYAVAAAVASQNEGDSGTTDFKYVVTRSGLTTGSSTVSWALSGDLVAADFGGSVPSGTLTFGNNDTLATITVGVSGDNTQESDETLTLTISNPSAGTVLSGQGSASTTVLGDDDSFAIAAVEETKTEGHSGTTNVLFTVTRTGPKHGTKTVDYSVGDEVNGTDIVGGQLPTGTLTFADGESTQTITVAVQGDTTVESDEDLTVTLSNAQDSDPISTAADTTTITNEDAGLAIAALLADKTEGNSGTVSHTFTVTRTGYTSQTSTVSWSLAGSGDNPTDGSDFSGATSGTLTFASGGANLQTVTVASVGDSLKEEDETFNITLSSPSTGTIVETASAGGTITNNDARVQFNQENPTVSHGESDVWNSYTDYVYTIVRDGYITQGSEISWNVSGSADGVQTSSGTLSFASGDTTKNLTIKVGGDYSVENDENFTVTLSSPTAGTCIGSYSTATGTVTNDDVGVGFYSNDMVSHAEGLAGSTTDYTFVIQRTGVTSGETTANWQVYNDKYNDNGYYDATNSTDFVDGSVPSGTVTFAATETLKTVTVQINGDSTVENGEYFNIRISGGNYDEVVGTNYVNGEVLRDESVLAIKNEFTATSGGTEITSTNSAGAKYEQDSGTVEHYFKVTRTISTVGEVTVDYTVTNVAASGWYIATDNGDFVGNACPTGTVTFVDGQSEAWITITTTSDTIGEDDESFTITLSNQTVGNSIGDASQSQTGHGYNYTYGFIKNDDPLFRFDGSDTLSEGDSGYQDVVLQINRLGDYNSVGTVTFSLNLPGSEDTWGTVTPGNTADDNTTQGANADQNTWYKAEAADLTDTNNLLSSAGTVTGVNGTTQTLTFAADQQYQYVTVRVKGDIVTESWKEELTLTLTAATDGDPDNETAGVSTFNTSATVTIYDDETTPPVYYFNESVYSIQETDSGYSDMIVRVDRGGRATGVGTVTYTLTLPGTETTNETSPGEDGAVENSYYKAEVADFGENITTAGGSVAVANGANGILTFAANSTTAYITLSVKNDLLTESWRENFTLTLSNAGDSLAADASVHSTKGTTDLIIIDDDDESSIYALEKTSYTYYETDPEENGTGNVVIKVLRAGNTDSSGTVTFTASIPGVESTNETTFGTMLDANTNYKADISDIYRVRSSAGSVYTGGEGEAGELSSILTFNAGETFKYVTIQVNNDDFPETWKEDLTFTLSNPTDGGTIDSAYDEATVRIIDMGNVNTPMAERDPSISQTADPVIKVEAVQTSYMEGSAGDSEYTEIVFRVTREDDPEIDGNLNVPTYLYFGISATTPSDGDSVTSPYRGTPDYIAGYKYGGVDADGANINNDLLNATLTEYSAGSNTARGGLTFVANEKTKLVTFQVKQDTTVEEDEIFNFTLFGQSEAPNDGWGPAGPNSLYDSAYTTIANDDVRMWASYFSASGNDGTALSSFYEGDSGSTPIVVVLARHGKNTHDIELTYEITGTAGNTTDLSATTGTITFAASDSQETRYQTFTVATVNGDTTVEADEGFTVTFTSADANSTFARYYTYAGSSTMAVTGTILGDDATWSIANGSSASQTELDEGNDRAFTFVVTRSNYDYSGAASINWAVTGSGGNPADVNTDFEGATSGTVYFGNGANNATITVYANGDLSAENDEGFTVTISIPEDGKGSLGTATATATILTDDTGISIGNGTTISEGDSGTTNMEFVVTRSGDTSGASGANWAISHTSTAAGDFSGSTSGSVTFTAGQTLKTITVAIQGDTDVESTESFAVQLSNLSGVDDAINISGSGTIRNDDSSWSISASTASSNEASSGNVYVITRTSATYQDEVVHWAVTGTGENQAVAADFGGSLPGGDLTFTGSELSKTITIAATDDAVWENDETYTVTITRSTGAENDAITQATADGTIVNDDARVSISIANATQSEGSGTNTDYVVTLTRTGSTAGESLVDWALNHTDTDANDFTGATSGTVTFADGQSVKTVTLTVVADSTVETGAEGAGTEYFSVGISKNNESPVNTEIGTATAQGGLTNDDSTISIAVGSADKNEGNSGTTPFTFVITRSGYLNVSKTVDYAVSGAAVDGTDFNGGSLPSGSVNLASGASSVTLTIDVAGDTTAENDEAFTVTLSNPANGVTITGGGTANGTIRSDDINFNLAAVSSTSQNEQDVEQTTDFVYTVTRQGNTAGDHTVDWAVTGRGADPTSADDFVATSGSVTFADSESVKTFTVQVAGDISGEADEGFRVTISNPVAGEGASSALPTVGTATSDGTIVDNEASLRIAAVSSNQYEGANGASTDFVFTVTRSGNATPAVGVDWAVVMGEGGSAVDASDFSSATNGSLSFATTETVKTITVTVAGDHTVENDETLTVSLSNASAGADIKTASVSRTIMGDDTNWTLARVGDAAVNEADSSSSSAHVFTLTRTGGLAAATVDISVAGSGTNAATAADFGSSFPAPTLTFAQGDTVKTFTISPSGDNTLEEDETFTVTAGTPSGVGVHTYTTSSLEQTITNDDDVMTIEALASGVTEGDSGTSAATYTITRTGSTVGSSTVSWRIASGGETNASDFSATSGIVTFGDGESSKTLTLNVVGDRDVEMGTGGVETYNVELYATGAGSTLGNIVTAQGTITNNDIDLTLAGSTTSGNEGDASSGTTFVYTVTRSGLTSGATTVDWAVVAGTAGAADFGGTLPSGTLSFSADQTSKEITFACSGDGTYENSETFTVQLSNASGNADIVGNNQSGTITNDDDNVSISGLNVTRAEGESVTPRDFTFTVNRNNGTGAATVNWTVAGLAPTGHPTVDADFSGATSGTVTFANGETDKTITVNVVDDGIGEYDEYFKVTLSDASFGSTIISPISVGTIQNDDPAFTIAAVTGSANEGTASDSNQVFRITRSGDTTGSASLTWEVGTSGSHSADPMDFGGLFPNGTVNFSNGESTKDFTVVVAADSTGEFDETFSVTLTATDTGNILSGGSSAVGTITNDDTVVAIAGQNATQTEGHSGSKDFTFVVTRSGLTNTTSTVDWAVTGYGDYFADATDFVGAALPSGSLTFTSGQTLKTITVQVAGDNTDGSDDQFVVTLSNGGNTQITTSTAVGTIQNDDNNISITAVTSSVTEGNSGQADLVYRVTRTGATTTTAYVDYQVTGTGEHAAAASDFAANQLDLKHITFNSGETEKLITIKVSGDTTAEVSESLRIDLVAAEGATGVSINQASAYTTGTIVSDDVGVAVVAQSATFKEGQNGDTSPFIFTVNRFGSSTSAVAVNYSIATAGGITSADFVGGTMSGTVTLAADATSANITVNVAGDNTAENDENFTVTITSDDATVTGATASGTIQDDDSGIYLSLDSTASQNETGAVFIFTATRNDNTNEAFDLTASLGGITGTANIDSSDITDYNSSLTFSFGEGASTASVTLTVAGDDTVEKDETFRVTLNSVNGHTLISGRTYADATILNDDSVSDEDGSTIHGSNISEALTGGDGADTIFGSGGSDVLTGGAGIDIFVYNDPSEGGDAIVEFEAGIDKIQYETSAFGNLTAGEGGVLSASEQTFTSLNNAAIASISADSDVDFYKIEFTSGFDYDSTGVNSDRGKLEAAITNGTHTGPAFFLVGDGSNQAKLYYDANTNSGNDGTGLVEIATLQDIASATDIPDNTLVPHTNIN